MTLSSITMESGEMNIKEIKVSIIKYETDDGKIFDTIEKAHDHVLRTNGMRKQCPACLGVGKIDPFGDGRDYIRCPNCQAKGYVDRQEVWK